MELWFILAVASALIGGCNAFLHKVVVEKSLDVYVVTFSSALASAFVLLIITAIWGNWTSFYNPMFFFALLWGILFSVNLILKVEALRYIDSTIYFPIYKILGPLFVIIAGILLFNERFTALEWVGLVFSMMIPLMLISSAENKRQKNLKLGIIIIIIGSIMAAIAAVAVKYGLSMTTDFLSFITAAYIFLAFSSLCMLVKVNGKNSMHKLTSSFSRQGTFQNVLLASVFGVLSIIAGQLSIYLGGPLGVVYTINSLYILIPIVLSIIIYKEHWNIRKVVSIVLSIAALALLK